MFWRYGVPLIAIGAVILVAAGWAIWYAMKRRRVERAARALRQREENRRMVEDYFDREFKDLGGGA
jgi:hypothetical protein